MSDNYRRRPASYNNNNTSSSKKSARQWILILIVTFFLVLLTVLLFSWTLYMFATGVTPGTGSVRGGGGSGFLPSDSLQSTRSSLPAASTPTSTASASNSYTKPTLPHLHPSSSAPSTTHSTSTRTTNANPNIVAYVTPYKLPPDPDSASTSTDGGSGLDPSTPVPVWFEPSHFYPNRFTSNTSTSPNTSPASANANASKAFEAHDHDSGQFRPFHASVWDPCPQYKFNAFGTTWHLSLRSGGAAASIIPIVIHHEGNTTRRDPVGLDTGCFYTGTVAGDETSLVSVSLCQGMTGHIRTRTGSYFIEPLDTMGTATAHGQDQDKSLPILHKLYRLGGNSNSDNSHNSSSSDEIPSPKFHDDDFIHGDNNNDDAHLSRRRKIATLSGDDINHHHQAEHRENVEINYGRGRRRTKRSMSRERHIELMVVTDSTMSAYHGENLKHYVLTLLSIVALIYSDASIGNPMNVALVKFHILKDVDFIWKEKTAAATTASGYPQSDMYNHYNSIESHGHGLGHQHHSSSSGSASASAVNYGISASEMLRNFCKWQKEHNHADDSSPLHHDTALLLTRETICRNPWLQKCDTLGLAELGTMCDNYASCAIVQDNGLSAAFTIAHELGHVMNMPHDDDVKCLGFLGNSAADSTSAYRMDSGPGSAPSLNIFASSASASSSAPSQSQDASSSSGAGAGVGIGTSSTSTRSVTAHYVMSRMLDHNTYPWAWSKCSRHYLTEFLDAGHGLCLEDRPPSNLLQAVQAQNQRRQPGEIFSKDRQCELVFGPDSQLCSYMPVCRRLWCTSDEIDGCRTQHMPWADGTPCTPSGHKWCQRGACVLKDLEQLRVVDGDWGHWKPFGPCSRSCSGGVRRSTRECDNPPPSNGGKYCIGPRIRYESCSTHDCPGEHRDFRAEQCAQFNNDNFNIQGLPRNVTWVPKYTGIITKDRCKLFCRVGGSSAYYLLREKVIDGTPCAPDTFDVCVNGACLPAGCDRKLHSTKVLDACGICNGDSSTCRTHSGSYNDTKYGYNTVVRIPAGASNLDVRQRGANDSARDDNYLAIMDPATNEYLLNGHFVVSMFRKTIHAMGSTLEYSGSDSATERINATLPLKNDLIVQVLSVGKLWQPDIRYQYVISTGAGGGGNDQPEISYRWVLSDDEYTECSRICQGTRSRPYICVRRLRQSPSSQVQVESAYCSGDPPSQARLDVDCNTDCVLKWSCAMAGNGDCSREAMTCVKFVSVQNTSMVVPSEHCLSSGLPRECDDCPILAAVAPPSPPEWSACSRVCGEGVQTCKNNCEGQSQQVRRCNKGPCGQWRISEWSPCSTTCGSHGVHRALYACHHSDGSLLPHEYCTGTDSPKPVVERKCENPPCNLQWIVGEWSQCSGTCGSGRMHRQVQCVRESGTVNERYCDQLLKPLSESECRHREECPSPRSMTHTHAVGSVSKLASANSNSNSRNYEISNEVGPFDTGPGRSSVSVLASGGIGGAIIDWIAEAWSECESETNFRVYRRRKVYCASGELQCAAVKRPAAIEECVGAWWISDWGICNTTCGEGIETRTVRCPIGQLCAESARPTQTRRPCINNSKCKYRRGFTDGWNIGAWGKCSKLCGGGVKLRQVVCVTPTVADHCKDKPVEMMACNSDPCPVWYTGSWSECTVDCGGGGHQERNVQCRDTNNVVQPDDHCAHFSIKPNSTQECGTKECVPVQHKNLHGNWVTRWTVGAWSNCSKTCGKGIKRRLVQCTRLDRARPSSSLTVVNDTECSAGHGHAGRHTHSNNNVAGKKKAKPREQRGCARFPCPHKWVTSEWSECSTTCGYGLQQRSVGCHRVNKYGWVDPDPVSSGCESLGPQPQAYRYCRYSVDCSPRTLYRWVVSDWSECPPASSSKCGREYKQKRKVYCALNSTGTRVGGSFCGKEHKPVRRRACPRKSCKLSSCADKHRDGEYMMWAGGANISIYCSSAHHSDNSVHTHPIRRREYLTLPEHDNFAEFYGKRLIRPDTCPANGQRLDSCECVEDVNHRIGYTKWEKVRIDIDRLIVDVDDMTYTRQISGSPIPFGSSGDCYSNLNCPQGQFSINLQGTGLQVDPATTWTSQGHKAAMWINKSEDNVRVTGKCGGYCGSCAPNRLPGLKLQPL